MTKIKNMLKKGFTLTELAIVIAVIAILVAVLVPTFISLIDSANESKDTQMIYNVNQALSIESATTDIKTPSQALDVAAEAGYNIDKLTPTSDSEIYYDQSNVRFVIKFSDGTYYPSSAAEDFEEDAPTTWKFVDEDTYTALNTTANTGSVSYSLAKTTVKSAAETTASGATIHTCSYIAKGDWFTSTLSYTGMGGIDTTRATGITKVEYTIQSATDTTYPINPVYSVSEEVKYVPIIIATNYTDPITITKNCAAEDTMSTVKPADDVTCTVNVDSVDCYDEKNISWDTTSENITVTVTVNGNDVTTAAYAGDLTTVETGAEAYAEASASSDDTTAVVLELGTEKYPYLIDDLSVIETKVSASSLDTVYFKLTADISFTADIEVSVDKNIVLNGDYHTITQAKYGKIFKLEYSSDSNSDSTLEIYNSTFVGNYASSHAKCALKIYGFTSVDVKDCSFKKTTSPQTSFIVIEINNAKVINIESCEFDDAGIAIILDESGNEKDLINFYDVEFEAETKKAGPANHGLINISTTNSNAVEHDVEINFTEVEITATTRRVISESLGASDSNCVVYNLIDAEMNITYTSGSVTSDILFGVNEDYCYIIKTNSNFEVNQSGCSYIINGETVNDVDTNQNKS